MRKDKSLMEIIEILEKSLHGFKFLLWALATHLFHYRQNFYHWSLWVPVITLYILAVNLWFAEFIGTDWLLNLLVGVLVVVIVTHLWGAYLHLAGVSKRVDGQTLHNHMVGPPIILPLIVATVASIDLLRLLQGGLNGG